MGKNLSKSKTVKANLFFVLLQAINGSIALFQPFLDPQQFALVSMLIGITHGAVGTYLRTITSEPIK